LVYTSGTTGNSKGVMTSHDNLTWLMDTVFDYAYGNKEKLEEYRTVSYLPLSHVAGLGDIIGHLYLG